MTEAITNSGPRPDRLGLMEGIFERSQANDSVVPVIGIKTGVGVLVTVAGVSLGFAEPDGSEDQNDEKSTPDKPADSTTLLKNCIEANTGGDVQKVALYLANLVGTKVSVNKLVEEFGRSRVKTHYILETIRDSAIFNNWPFLLVYSANAGAGFFPRK